MSSTAPDQFLAKPVVPQLSTSRRRLLAGLLGGGAILALGSPVAYYSAQRLQHLVLQKKQDFGISDKDISRWEIVWSNDLAYAAVPFTEQKQIRIWDYERQRAIGPLDGYGDEATMAWSPDQRRLASIYENTEGQTTVICWDVQTAQRLYTISASFPVDRRPIWSPDGKKIAAFGDGMLTVLDAANGQIIAKQIIPGEYSDKDVSDPPFIWSPTSDGVALSFFGATTKNKRVVQWDIKTNRQVNQFALGEDSYIRSLSWSPNGEYLAAVVDQQLRLFHMSDNRKSFTFGGSFKNYVHLLAWSPDSRYLAATDYGTLGACDVKERRWVNTFGRAFHAFDILALAWAGDGKQVIIINDASSRVYLSW